MLFKPELIWAIVRRQKRQTRRPIKPIHSALRDSGTIVAVQSSLSRKTASTVYQVGKDYAVCPKRGKQGVWWSDSPTPLLAHETKWGTTTSMWDMAHIDTYHEDGLPDYKRWLTQHGFAPLRIRITGIRQEDVRDISDADAHAEGFASRYDFWMVWTSLYRPTYYRSLSRTHADVLKDNTPHGLDVWAHQFLYQDTSPVYTAWVIDFEPVKGEGNERRTQTYNPA